MPDNLEIVRSIQATDRFEAYEASYKGQKVFAKKALSTKTCELLARVPQNSAAANQLGQKTDFRFRTPQIIAHSDNWLVTEWIEGEAMSAQLQTAPSKVAGILVDFLLAFEREPLPSCDIRKTFTAQSLDDYMAEKLPKNLEPAQARLVAEAKARFDQLSSTLAAAWQDGDIKPDHIFSDPELPGAFVLIDPEHFDPRWPRFYSLANNYVKHWVRRQSDFSKELIRRFMAGSELPESEVFEPLLASIIVRCISLHWENDYDPGALDYNIPRSQELLARVLQADGLHNLL